MGFKVFIFTIFNFPKRLHDAMMMMRCHEIEMSFIKIPIVGSKKIYRLNLRSIIDPAFSDGIFVAKIQLQRRVLAREELRGNTGVASRIQSTHYCLSTGVSRLSQ